jgi:pimeloyl-ACP methyl ester carboxylesterase
VEPVSSAGGPIATTLSKGCGPGLASGAGAVGPCEGGDDPLALIHRIGLSRRSWKPVLPILTPEHDVLALDLPGFGTASPLHNRTPTVAA